MSKHTKGPWIIEGDEIRTGSGARQKDIALIVDPGFSDSCTRSSSYPAKKANAQLIAAAPDLLEALKCNLAEWIHYAGSNEPGGSMERARLKAIRLAKAAIAKAES